ncbi:MAG: hypothetical protein H7A25_13625 [Leptospiraceae bacterium]|nr:hypothetical protein [Leptospiraceae bacterium]
MNDNKQHFHMEVSPLWSLIAEVKNKVSSLMADYEKGQVEFASMVISELMENAIKYGVSKTDLPYVGVEFTIENSFVNIQISNGIHDESLVKDFLKIMQKIMESDNKEELYIMRMQEIMENPEATGSQLGLYRIASEAQYDLSYSIKNNILTIIATKQL